MDRREDFYHERRRRDWEAGSSHRPYREYEHERDRERIRYSNEERRGSHHDRRLGRRSRSPDWPSTRVRYEESPPLERSGRSEEIRGDQRDSSLYYKDSRSAADRGSRRDVELGHLPEWHQGHPVLDQNDPRTRPDKEHQEHDSNSTTLDIAAAFASAAATSTQATSMPFREQSSRPGSETDSNSAAASGQNFKRLAPFEQPSAGRNAQWTPRPPQIGAGTPSPRHTSGSATPSAVKDRNAQAAVHAQNGSASATMVQRHPAPLIISHLPPALEAAMSGHRSNALQMMHAALPILAALRSKSRELEWARCEASMASFRSQLAQSISDDSPPALSANYGTCSMPESLSERTTR